jgi:hypothetical protein
MGSSSEPFESNQIYTNEQFYLRTLQDLIWSYKRNASRKKRITFWSLAVMILISLGYTAFVYFHKMSFSSIHAIDLWSAILSGFLTFVLFVTLLNHRFEMNAIEWVSHELHIKVGLRDESEDEPYPLT